MEDPAAPPFQANRRVRVKETIAILLSAGWLGVMKGCVHNLSHF